MLRLKAEHKRKRTHLFRVYTCEPSRARLALRAVVQYKTTPSWKRQRRLVAEQVQQPAWRQAGLQQGSRAVAACEVAQSVVDSNTCRPH